ncbi:MAG TPA: hypothetical protein VLH08_04235 [Acidobacteriota bacterium]|nr:hypothetical protein [Acidobacteriota bacterium]
MRIPTFVLFAITVVVSVTILGNLAQAADNQVGIWKLNVAKSKFSPGPTPKEATLTIESQPDGLKITLHGTDGEGKAVHAEFSPKYDGKDYPAMGMPGGADAISLKKIDDYTIETVSKKDGSPLVTTRSVVSKDGKTRTSTQIGTNAKGETVNNTLVYEKQ